MLVNVYDSSYPEMDQDTKLLIGNYTNANKAKINIMNVQQQQNRSDCGVFAIAFAKLLLSGRDPTQLNFIDPRNHLFAHLPYNQIPDFPTEPARRSPQVLDKTTYYKLLPVKKVRNMMLTFLVSFNKLNMGY